MVTKQYIEDRVASVPESGCWIWMKSRTGAGYGDFRIGIRRCLAHRASYELWNGPIPEGLHVLHRCDVPACVNPAHLFVGTNLDNILDSVKKGRRKRPFVPRPRGFKYNWSEESKKKWIEGKRKIPEHERQKIRLEYRAGGISQQALADRYGVSNVLICRIMKEDQFSKFFSDTTS